MIFMAVFHLKSLGPCSKTNSRSIHCDSAMWEQLDVEIFHLSDLNLHPHPDRQTCNAAGCVKTVLIDPDVSDMVHSRISHDTRCWQSIYRWRCKWENLFYFCLYRSKNVLGCNIVVFVRFFVLFCTCLFLRENL